MCIKRMTRVQNVTKETWSDVKPNFLIPNVEGRFPSAAVGLS